MPKPSQPVFLKSPSLAICIIAIITYWLVDAGIDVLIFSQDSYLDALFSHRHEIIMRGTMVTLIITFCAYIRFITNKFKQMDEFLRKSERQYRDLVESASDLVQSVRPDGSYIYVNRAWKETLGYTDQEIAQLNIFQVIDPSEQEHCLQLFEQIMSIGQSSTVETIFKAKDGRQIAVEGNVTCKVCNGIPMSCMGIFRDVSKRKRRAARLHSQTVNDELTSLHNQHVYRSLVDKQLAIANRSGKELALLYLDVDDMKSINETLGHSLGDLALADTANLLQKTFRQSDIIGRIGGDEFAILLTERPEQSGEEIILQRFKENLAKLNQESGRIFELKLSLGLAYYDPMEPCTTDALITKAGSMMYQVRNGKGRAKN